MYINRTTIEVEYVQNLDMYILCNTKIGTKFHDDLVQYMNKADTPEKRRGILITLNSPRDIIIFKKLLSTASSISRCMLGDKGNSILTIIDRLTPSNTNVPYVLFSQEESLRLTGILDLLKIYSEI